MVGAGAERLGSACGLDLEVVGQAWDLGEGWGCWGASRGEPSPGAMQSSSSSSSLAKGCSPWTMRLASQRASRTNATAPQRHPTTLTSHTPKQTRLWLLMTWESARIECSQPGMRLAADLAALALYRPWGRCPVPLGQDLVSGLCPAPSSSRRRTNDLTNPVL